MRHALAFSTALLMASAAIAAADLTASESKRLDEAATVIQQFKAAPDSKGVPEDLWNKAECVTVIPNMKKAAFIVGGEYGEGALRVGGKTVGYYSTAAASFGLQAGAQSTAVIFLFMTAGSLEKFRSSSGWAVGADASVSLLKVGANGAIDTTSATNEVLAIVMTNAGLMADVSLSGTKVTRMNI